MTAITTTYPTGRIQDLILSPEDTGKISDVIAEGAFYGMQTFDQALLGYVMDGLLSEEVARDFATSPHDFKLMLDAKGERASGIEHVTADAQGTSVPGIAS